MNILRPAIVPVILNDKLSDLYFMNSSVMQPA